MALVAAEAVIHKALKDEFTTARVVTVETPANLADVLPCIEVSRFGGADDLLVLDLANIDIDVYGATLDDSRDLAEEIRTYLRLTLPGNTVAGGFVAAVTTISAPTQTPYTNTSVWRYTASYRIAIRSIP